MFSMERYDFRSGDLAAMLGDDSNGRVHAALIDTLVTGQRAVKSTLDKGVTPDEFAIGQKVLDSYEAAIEGVRLLRDAAESR